MENERFIIEVRNFGKINEDSQILSGLEFAITQGECLGLIGPKGSGKSTALKLLSGHEVFTEGEMFVHSFNARFHFEEMKSKISWIPDWGGLDYDFSVLDNMMLFGSYLHIKKQILKERCRDLLRLCHLEDVADTLVEHLDPLALKKIQIARSLINNPSLLLIDQSNKDCGIIYDKKEIWTIFKKLKKSGFALLITTNSIEEIETICDHVVFLNNRQQVAFGRPKDLKTDLIGEKVIEFNCKLNELKYFLEQIKSQFEYQVSQNRVRIFIRDSSQIRLAVKIIASQDYSIRGVNLQDVFLKLTGKELSI